jgi:hypothetical protein
MPYINDVLISNLLHNFFNVNPHPVSSMTQLSALYYMKNISTFLLLPSLECVANVSFEVYMVMTVKSVVSWVVTPCSSSSEINAEEDLTFLNYGLNPSPMANDILQQLQELKLFSLVHQLFLNTAI